MTKRIRQMIKIDEDKCNGCGLCVPACAEGAIRIIDGKAKVVAEKYCDGLGACLGECPQGAISFETREAEEFDEAATIQYLKETGRSVEAHLAHMAEHAAGGHAYDHHDRHGHRQAQPGFVCPSARTIDRTCECSHSAAPAAESVSSELRQWPVKLYLVNPGASFFQNADLLIVADCVPFAYGALHPDFLRGKVVVAGCPKFDDVSAHVEKLTEVFRRNEIRSVTVLKMEVPCCSGLGRATESAIAASGKSLTMETITISLSGEVMDKRAVAV